MGRYIDSQTKKFPDNWHRAVQTGRMDGWELLRKWNENAEVDSTQEEMSNIASGIRTLPSSAAVVTLASSSAEDGAGTSTGILTVRVRYLDANWEVQSETVTLNGTSNVTTTGTARRLRDVTALTTGSAGAAVGNITVSIGGNVQSRILIGQNETRESGFTVPADQVAMLDTLVVVAGRSPTVTVDFAVEVRDGITESPWITAASFEVYQTVAQLDVFDSTLPAGTDVRILATASGAGGPTAFVQLDYFLCKLGTFNA